MKQCIAAIAILTIVFNASCRKESLDQNENNIPINSCQSFKREGKLLNVCFVEVIEDSRCPVNAFCIWEGRAAARFTLHTNNTDHTITLSNLHFPPYSRDTTLAGFNIKFINLLPQQELDKPVNDRHYVAEVKITR